MNFKLKHVYIFFLLIIVSILVFIAQGVYQQEVTYTKPVEFNRVDGYSTELGKISAISVKISNDDSISHNYTIQVMTNSVSFTNQTVEVAPELPFSLSMTIPIEPNNSTTEERVHNVSVVVYRDDKSSPIDSILFNFN